MDVYCSGAVSPHAFTSAVSRQLPADIAIAQVYPVGLMLPSLQAQVRYADYTVTVDTEKEQPEIDAILDAMLAREQMLWQHQRDTGVRQYDLRALINDLWLIASQAGRCTLGMRLRCGSRGSGRPEQVVAALGFTDYPQSIHRTGLILETG
jgi:radical SAM-linked protein